MVSNRFATARNLTASSTIGIGEAPMASLPPAFVVLAPAAVREMQQMAAAGWPALYAEAYRRAQAAVMAQRELACARMFESAL